MENSELKIKLVRSQHHQRRKIKECIRVLGLRKIGHEVSHPNTPVFQGLVRKAIHLLEVNVVQK